MGILTCVGDLQRLVSHVKRQGTFPFLQFHCSFLRPHLITLQSVCA